MHKYKINIKKVSGRLNESAIPSKNLVVKSKTKKSKSTILNEASKYYKKNYGLTIESADVQEVKNDSKTTHFKFVLYLDLNDEKLEELVRSPYDSMLRKIKQEGKLDKLNDILIQNEHVQVVESQKERFVNCPIAALEMSIAQCK